MNQEMPEGAVKLHLYKVENILHPRGSMKKESLGELILERLKSAYESWTDPKYGDAPTKEQLLSQLWVNLEAECNAAWASFRSSINDPTPD